MTINGFNIKKYWAKVKDSTSENGYKIVEGYVSTAVLDYSKPDQQPIYTPCFVAEEINFNAMPCSGFGKTIYETKTYYEFEIVGEVE